jgi:hypothetical protein
LKTKKKLVEKQEQNKEPQNLVGTLYGKNDGTPFMLRVSLRTDFYIT